MWLWSILATATLALGGQSLATWFAKSTHVFTATVEALESTPSDSPRTKYGLRIGEELQGHVDTKYLVIETPDGIYSNERAFTMSSHGLGFGYREEILVFATVGMDGRLDLRTSELRILSRLPDARGVMFAHRVGTGGWNRVPLGETCSTTGDLVDISDSTEVVQTVQTSRCVWSAMIAWLRLLPIGATAAAHGEVPMPAGATPILGAPQRPLYEMLTR